MKHLVSLFHQLIKRPVQVDKVCKIIMTTTEKNNMLINMTSLMANLRLDGTIRGAKIAEEYDVKIKDGIEELRQAGCAEDTHPTFRSLVSSYKYWTKL